MCDVMLWLRDKSSRDKMINIISITNTGDEINVSEQQFLIFVIGI